MCTTASNYPHSRDAFIPPTLSLCRLLCRLLCHLDIPLDLNHLFAYWPRYKLLPIPPCCFFLLQPSSPRTLPILLTRSLIKLSSFKFPIHNYLPTVHGSLSFQHHPSLPFHISHLLTPVFIITGNHKSSRASAMACSSVIHTRTQQTISGCSQC